VSAVALLAAVRAAKATTAKIEINFETGFWTRVWVMRVPLWRIGRQAE
jgi:hypothetical protein